MNNLLEHLGKDLTHVYKLEGNCQRTAYTFAIERSIANKETGIYYFFHSALSFGDYLHSCDVERSNVRVFMEEFKDNPYVRHIKGSYGYKAIAIDVACDTEDIITLLQGLDNYCVLDDKDCSKMKMEMEEEAWDAFIKRDFMEAIEKKFKADWSDPHEGKLFELYKKLQEEANQYAEIHSGGIVYIDLKRLVAQLHKPPRFLKLEYFDS